jgi:hypothetical protein
MLSSALIQSLIKRAKARIMLSYICGIRNPQSHWRELLHIPCSEQGNRISSMGFTFQNKDGVESPCAVEVGSILSTMEDFAVLWKHGRRGGGGTVGTEWAQLRITRSPCPIVHSNLSIWKQNEFLFLKKNMWFIQIWEILKSEIVQYLIHFNSQCFFSIIVQFWEYFNKTFRIIG